MVSNCVLNWVISFCICSLGVLVYWHARCLILVSAVVSCSWCCFSVFLSDEYDIIFSFSFEQQLFLFPKVKVKCLEGCSYPERMPTLFWFVNWNLDLLRVMHWSAIFCETSYVLEFLFIRKLECGHWSWLHWLCFLDALGEWVAYKKERKSRRLDAHFESRVLSSVVHEKSDIVMSSSQVVMWRMGKHEVPNLHDLFNLCIKNG